jgi:hypothetical protein
LGRSQVGLGYNCRGIAPDFLEDVMWFKDLRDMSRSRLLMLVLIIPLAACSKPEKPSVGVFASPDDASTALRAAVKSGDQNALLAIFGPNSTELISSGDAVQDKNSANAFAARYDVMHRWRRMADGGQILLIGADNFAFPIPLAKNAEGRWFFDTAAGKEEILNRRVGRNELAVIGFCGAVVDAQAQYFSQLHDGATKNQFAAKFISDPGKQNGLSWKSPDGKPDGPLGAMAASAIAEGYDAKPDVHSAFHGYFFRMLKGQTDKAPAGAKEYLVDGKMVGGFAFVAYPAEYGNSGVMTFIINQDGVLLERDLGKQTAEIASAMTEFDPSADAGWKVVDEESKQLGMVTK